jgi:hypothetical protein
MWESIDESQQTKHNLTWLVLGMKSNTCIMGYRPIVRPEKGIRFMRSWLGNILQQDRTTVDRHILGEIPSGEFILGRNAQPVRPTPFCQSVVRVL